MSEKHPALIFRECQLGDNRHHFDWTVNEIENFARNIVALAKAYADEPEV